MAMDSARKRKAVPGVLRPWMRSNGNDATVGREWRASIGGAYPVANFQAPGGITYYFPVLSDQGVHSLIFGGLIVR